MRGQLGTAVRRVRLFVPRRELFHVHQEQGLRRCGDAGPGRRGRGHGRDLRERGHPVLWLWHRADAASTSSAATSARTATRSSCWMCCVRARRSASRSSCSAQSNSDPAEDFTITQQGLVSDFFTAGLVSAATDLHYGGAGCLPTAERRPVRLSRHGVQRSVPGLLGRTRSSTRRSAWTAACASASAAPPVGRHQGRPGAVRRLPPRPCGSRTGPTRRASAATTSR